MRTVFLGVVAFGFLAGGCATTGLTRPQSSLAASAAMSCCAGHAGHDELADAGGTPATEACKCKSDAPDTCSCAMPGSSCGAGAKTCKDTACRAQDCTCKNLLCPTMESAKSPHECDGNDHVSGGADHCKKK